MSYCLSCKSKTPDVGATISAVAGKGGSQRRVKKSTCGQCGKKKSCFMKAGGGKDGDGIFSWIPGGVGKALDNIGNTALSIGSQVAVPVLQGVLKSKLGGGARRRH